jgi:predicted Mrr-cat superfamily restriction endonuclease
MAEDTVAWGIHPLGPGHDFIKAAVIALDRPRIGSLHDIGEDRDAMKGALRRSYPDEPDGTIAAWAGVLLLFGFAASGGDFVVHPNKANRTLAFGRLDGDYYFDESNLHCRRVRWTVTGVPRDAFSDEAKKTVSARTAFFRVRETDEFERWLAERGIG